MPVVGDWNGDGADSIGAYVFNHFYLRNSVTPGPPDLDIYYGSLIDRPVTGDFNGGAHVDTIGAVEPA